MKKKKMKKKKPKKNKEFITHGVFSHYPLYNLEFPTVGETTHYLSLLKTMKVENFHISKKGIYIYIRNTTEYLPLPLKFQELLEKTYLDCWYIKRTIRKFKKNVRIEGYAKIPVEFTINHIPEIHLMVIAIAHPLNPFKRKSGVKIVKQRMEWALKNFNEERSWIFKLKKR